MSLYASVVEQALAAVSATPLRVDWFATSLRVHTDSDQTREHLARQYQSSPPRFMPAIVDPPAELYTVANAALLHAIRSRVADQPAQPRESFRGVWYSYRELPSGDACLVVDERHAYPHALVTQDFRSWAFVGDRTETVSCEVTRTIRELVREDLLARGALMFHASAAELPDGRGIFLAGASAAGKTSAAIRLALGGGRIIGTDRTFLLPHDGSWFAVGLPVSTRLGVGSAKALGIEHQLAEQAALSAGKYAVSNALVGSLLGCAFTAVTEADSLIVLESVPGEQVRLKTLGADSAVPALRAQLLAPDPEYRSCWLHADSAAEPAQAAVDRLPALVEQHPVSRVCWDPALHCGEQAAVLLAEIARVGSVAR